jgi:serine/threonine protein kinase
MIARREFFSNRKPFESEEIFKWSQDILSALVYLHSKQIVHGDVKPK